MMKSRFAGIVLTAFAVALFAGSAMANGTEKCPPGDAKIESGPWQYCSKDGVITSICIKAGNRTYTFTADGSDKCYDVKGLGTDCVYVSGGGTGRDCKEISGITFYVEKK